MKKLLSPFCYTQNDGGLWRPWGAGDVSLSDLVANGSRVVLNGKDVFSLAFAPPVTEGFPRWDVVNGWTAPMPEPSPRVYIAGPMRGYPEFNFPAFHAAESSLAKKGYRVHNPARIDELNGFSAEGLLGVEEELKDMDYREIVLRDIQSLVFCQMIYMLRGWEGSTGARAEHAVAVWLNLEVMYESE